MVRDTQESLHDKTSILKQNGGCTCAKINILLCYVCKGAWKRDEQSHKVTAQKKKQKKHI